MSHHGERHQATPDGPPGAPGVMTYGAWAAGEVLAGRYQLAEHINTDAAGRQIWRGIDIVLRRPVAVVLREPGGETAAPMLTAAVAASRLVHPHIVSVYDAIDEGHRAYLVREWVAGTALRDVLAQVPLDAERSTLVAHAIAEAVAALHAAGIVHGNIHPGTVLIADDGRVVLADAHGDGTIAPEADVRAVGAVLYGCLTGRWPHAEAGTSTLPDAVRHDHGQLASPRQVRGGLPHYLDEITTHLLDQRMAPPASAAVAAELARLAVEGFEPDLDGGGPMGFDDAETTGSRRPSGAKIALGVVVLTAIAAVGGLVGVKVLATDADGTDVSQVATDVAAPPAGAAKDRVIAVGANQVRIVDPPRGDRTELEGVEMVVDGDEMTGWKTDEYLRANFGGLKPGMGILVDLLEPTKVKSVKVVVSQQGASAELRAGNTDPGSTTEGDKVIVDTYAVVGQPFTDHPGTTMVFPVEGQEARYLLIWITKLPADADGKFTLSVNEITVLAG